MPRREPPRSKLDPRDRVRREMNDQQPPAPPRPSPASKSRSGGEVPEEFADASRGVRLQKYMAEAGVASRRACEQLIADGHVSVNGHFITALPAWIDPYQDRIEVQGRPVQKLKRPQSSREGGRSHGGSQRQHIYVILNKPRRVISTSNDDLGRMNVVEMVDLPENLARRIYPVGRLDSDSTGLILLTDDGELANRLTHPRYGIKKKYLVTVKGKLTPEDVQRLRNGIYLATPDARRDATPGRVDRRDASSDESRTPSPAPHIQAKRAKMEEVELVGFQHDRERGDRTRLLITLSEGQNREIRRMLARLGFKVRRLHRVAIGPIHVKGLENGGWRLLQPDEIYKLRKVTGMLKKDRDSKA